MPELRLLTLSPATGATKNWAVACRIIMMQMADKNVDRCMVICCFKMNISNDARH
jgi:hypothetical protein